MTLFTRRRFIASTLATTLAGQALADGHSKSHTVVIKGHAFTPATLTIKSGETVTFINEDAAPHTATATNKSFDTKRLNKGASASLTFSNPGSFDYFCKFHRKMKGRITVA